MRNTFIIYSLFSILCLASCSQDDNIYDGVDWVQWADTLSVLPVVDNDEVFDITLSATRIADHDRTVAVEMLADQSNAIQGYHYDLLTHTVVIPAGQLTANVKVRGYTDHLAVGDSIGFILHLIAPSTSQLYGTQTRVLLQKACHFDIHDFQGYAVVTSSWIYNYMPDIEQRLIRVEPDPSQTNRLILRSFLYDGYDVHIDLTSDDILNPIVHYEKQVFAPTVEAFGTIYGNGKIMMEELNYVSFYSSCERFIYLYTYLQVEDVGVVGLFAHVLKFVSDEEAERLIRNGINH